jgi:hypothetical protein
VSHDGPAAAGEADAIERPSTLPKALGELAARCAQENIETELREWEDGSYTLILQIPNGRVKRRLPVREDSWRLDLLARTPFSRYTYVGDYEAIACYADSYIEAGIASVGMSAARRDIRNLPGVERLPLEASPQPQAVELANVESEEDSYSEGDVAASRSWRLVSGDPAIAWSLELSPPTEDFEALYTGIRLPRRPLNIPTLKIRGVNITNHDHALEVLETIRDSLFFDIDLRYGLALALQRIRSRRPSPIRSRTEISQEPVQLPRSRYAREPLALYWYARSAVGMPLLQYLAFYQSLEFYFSVYSRREALTRLRYELRDPRFNINEDAHLSRILSLATMSGSGFGNERDQLKATVRACLDSDRLRDFLTADPNREEHFTGRQGIRGVRRIDFANRQADLRDQVANRIYDLRCRIVHTKDEPEVNVAGLLLPYSREAESVAYDVELIRFVSQKVLIAGGSALLL